MTDEIENETPGKYTNDFEYLKIHSQKYFVTITLSSDLLKLPLKSQLKSSYFKIIDLILTYGNCLVSGSLELTKQCNAHYHIIVNNYEEFNLIFLDKLKSLKFTKNGQKFNVIGFTKCDEIKKDNGVSQYVDKDLYKTERILKRLGIDIDIYRPSIQFTDDKLRRMEIKMNVRAQKNILDYLKKDKGQLDNGITLFDED